MRAHPAGNVGVTDAISRIGESQRATGPRRPKRAGAAKPPNGTRLHKAERELDDVRFHAFVIESTRRRNRRCGQQVQRLVSQAELVTVSSESTVSMGNAPCRTNAIA